MEVMVVELGSIQLAAEHNKETAEYTHNSKY